MQSHLSAKNLILHLIPLFATSIIFGATRETVTTAEDQDNVATGGKSLREAISDVDDGGTIQFHQDVALATHRLTLGELVIDGKKVTIDGSGARTLTTIDAQGMSRVINVLGSGSGLTLRGLKITGGRITSGNGAGVNAGSSGTPVLIEDCWFSNNSGRSFGGALLVRGQATISRCTFSDNVAAAGGAIGFFQNVKTVTNCSFFRNEANGGSDGGGAIFASPNTAITHCTFSQNSSSSIGGAVTSASGTITVAGCVFDRNIGTSQFGVVAGGTVNSAGYNLDDGNEGVLNQATDIASTPAELRPFGNYLGCMPTLPPAEGSALINAIPNPSPFSNVPTRDQRKFLRRIGARYDIGAVEAFPVVTVDATYSSVQDALDNAGSAVRLKFSPSASGATIMMPRDREFTVENGATIIDASHLDEPVRILGDGGYRLMHTEGVHMQVRKVIFENGNSGQTLTGNVGDGGAVYVGEDSEDFASFVDCFFLNNETLASGSGGAINAAGSSVNLMLERCTFATNSSGEGGAIKLEGARLIAINCTFNGNSSSGTATGSAVHASSGEALFTNCTFTENLASSNGAAILAAEAFVISHCLWQDNTIADVIASPVQSDGHNLSDRTPAGFGSDDLTNIDVPLSLLGDHGGCVPTRLPAADSPAIDSGRENISCPPLGDARKLERVRGGRIDIGAVEAHSDYLCDIEVWMLERLPVGHRTPDDDSDGDGLVALAEWVLGLDPGKADASQAVHFDGDFDLLFELNTAAKDFVFIVETSTDLSIWETFYRIENGTVIIGRSIDTVTDLGNNRESILLDLPAGDRLFSRIRIE